MKQITVKSQTVTNLVTSTCKDFQLFRLIFAIVAWSTVGISKYSTIELKHKNLMELKIFFNPLCSVESALHAEKGVEKK